MFYFHVAQGMIVATEVNRHLGQVQLDFKKSPNVSQHSELHNYTRHVLYSRQLNLQWDVTTLQ